MKLKDQLNQSKWMSPTDSQSPLKSLKCDRHGNHFFIMLQIFFSFRIFFSYLRSQRVVNSKYLHQLHSGR